MVRGQERPALDGRGPQEQTRSMKKKSITVGVSLVLVASLVLAPTAALAGGRAFAGRPFVSHARPFAFNHHPFVFHQHPFAFRQPFFFPHHFRPFVPFGFGVGVVAPPLYAYAAPPAYYSSPSYADPPPYYAPPASSYYAPPAYATAPSSGTVAVAPVPNVVEYPNGRYVLRGDGITIPYTWVWIPNPPPPPPAAAPTDPPAPREQAPAPRRESRIYRWIDDQGTVHLTDSLAAVPKKFLAEVNRGR